MTLRLTPYCSAGPPPTSGWKISEPPKAEATRLDATSQLRVELFNLGSKVDDYGRDGLVVWFELDDGWHRARVPDCYFSSECERVRFSVPFQAGWTVPAALVLQATGEPEAHQVALQLVSSQPVLVAPLAS